MSPVTRPRNRSGTSSCAAELISTQDEPWPTPHTRPAARATGSEPATAKRPYAGRYNAHASMLARAFRRTGKRASAAPAQIDPNAYAAATSEKLPAPRPSVERTSSGTPTIHVPDDSVTARPSTTTGVAAAAGAGSVGRRARPRGDTVVGDVDRRRPGARALHTRSRRREFLARRGGVRTRVDLRRRRTRA